MVKNTPEIKNRQAFRDYSIETTYDAGLQLSGSEIKSLREGDANLKGSFAKIEGSEIFLYNMHINPYKFSREELAPLRPRKLLLHKAEIRTILTQISQKGYTLVPLKIFFSHGYAKVALGLGKGKKLHDKRDDLKKKQVNKEISRELNRRR